MMLSAKLRSVAPRRPAEYQGLIQRLQTAFVVALPSPDRGR